MPGIDDPNLPAFFQAPSGQRAPVSGADFDGGMNKGGGNAPGVGIATGDYGVNGADWSEDQRLLQESQAIGQAGDDINLVQGADVNDEVSFVQADGNIADGAELRAGTGALNRTGAVVPNGSWAWGSVPVA